MQLEKHLGPQNITVEEADHRSEMSKLVKSFPNYIYKNIFLKVQNQITGLTANLKI